MRRIDRIHRLPRLWSNRELARFAGLFEGDIVNVSAWRDEDKDGRCYADYFTNRRSYTVTNFDPAKRGHQGRPGELFLDLEQPLPPDLAGRFDVVLNHTTLEHVFDFQTAFQNLCHMSSDVVIIVVPFLQPMHADYGDYWRFSPAALIRLFKQQEMSVAYLSFNNDLLTSVYVFAIGTKKPERWRGVLDFEIEYSDPRAFAYHEPYAGSLALRASAVVERLKRTIRRARVRENERRRATRADPA